MSVELAFCDLWENFNHWVNSDIYVVVVVQYLRAIIQESSTNKFVDVEYLNDDIHQVDDFKKEEPNCILVVLVFVFQIALH